MSEIEILRTGPVTIMAKVDKTDEISRVHNELVEKDMELCKDIRVRADKLKDWNKYIEFRGQRYGCSKFIGDIHMENNCGGHLYDEEEKARGCFIYWTKCDRCNKVHSYTYG